HASAAKTVTAISLLAMVYFAVYPFGVRPHMPMAKYLYRHPPKPNDGPIYSFTEPFRSYPMFRPAGFKTEQLRGAEALELLVNSGPVFLMTDTPAPPVLPAGMRAVL